MYWLLNEPVNTDPFEPSAGETGPKGLTFAIQAEAAFAKAFNIARIEKFYLTLEDNAKKLNTKVANGLQYNLKNIEDTIYNVYKQGLDYGFAYGDAKEFIGEISEGMGRMVTYQTESVFNAIALGKAMGISAKEVATMVKDMMVMGMGPEKANKVLTDTFVKARLYGVDASKLTKTVSENIFKAQAYGFKDGVEGMTKMAIQAQRLGISMDLAKQAAEKAFDPEGAIEMASSIQMLGGNIGALGDPFQLIHMAQSDIGELTNQIGKASSTMVSFNKKTGEFSISPEMRRNMTEQAKALGMDYDTLAGAAIKFRKEQEISSRINLSGLKEEDRSLIASLAQIEEGGKVMVQIPGTTEMIDASTIGTKELAKLREKQEEVAKLSDPKAVAMIAQQQLSVQDKMAKSLEEIKNAGIFGVGLDKGKKITGAIGTMAEDPAIKILTDKVQETITQTGGLADKAIEKYTDTIDVFNTTMTNLNNAIITNIQTIKNALTQLPLGPPSTGTTPTTGFDVFIPPTEGKTISTGLGQMIKLSPLDASLNIPMEDMSNLFDYANLGNKMSKIKPSEINIGKEVETLSQYVEQKVTVEKVNQLNVAGSTDVNLKIESNIPNDLLIKIIDTPELKNTIMATVNERLSKGYSEKLINAITTG